MTKEELNNLLIALKATKVHPADTRWKWVRNQLKIIRSK